MLGTSNSAKNSPKNLYKIEFIVGQLKNKCSKFSSGTLSRLVMSQKVQFLLTFGIKWDTLVFIPKLLLINLNKKSRTLFGKVWILHKDIHLPKIFKSGAGISKRLKKVRYCCEFAGL